MTALIRLARPEDADAVFALAVELATTAVPERTAFDRSWRTVLGDPEQLLLVAEVAGSDYEVPVEGQVEGQAEVEPQPGDGSARVVGYLHGMLHPAFHANGPIGWVEEVCVTGTRRGGGIGRALMARFETLAGSRDVAYVAVATRRADAFYRALGYEESARYFRKLTGVRIRS